MQRLKACTLVFPFLLGASLAGADDLQTAIQQLSGAAARAYVAPIVTGFGANMNSGWYHQAPSADKFRLTFQAGAIGMGTLLNGAKKTFAQADSFRFDTAQARALVAKASIDPNSAQGQALVDTLISKNFGVTISGPTIIGAKHDTAQIFFPGKTLTVRPNGGPAETDSIPPDSLVLKGVVGAMNIFSRYAFPLTVPQITVGTVWGTNLTLRWLPTYRFQTVGAVSLFGFGIQHNPSIWFPRPMPVDFCVGYFHQDLSASNLFKATSNAVSLDVSKTFGGRIANVTPYGGLQWEQSSVSFHYNFTVEDPATGETLPERIAFDAEGQDHFRATAGLSFRLLYLNFNADYSLAQCNAFSAGVMIGI